MLAIWVEGQSSLQWELRRSGRGGRGGSNPLLLRAGGDKGIVTGHNVGVGGDEGIVTLLVQDQGDHEQLPFTALYLA